MSPRKLIEEKKDFYVAYKNVENNGHLRLDSNQISKVQNSESNSNEMSNAVTNSTAVQHQTEKTKLLDAKNYAIHNKSSEKVADLEKTLQRYLNYSEVAMNALANFMAKFDGLQQKVVKLLNTTDYLNLSLIASNSELKTVTKTLNQSILKINSKAKATEREMQQMVDLKVTQISNKSEHLLQDLYTNISYRNQDMNRTFSNYHQALTQARKQDDKIREITNQYFHLERRVNLTLTNISFFEANYSLNPGEKYLKDFINRQNSALNHRIGAIENQLQSSVEQSAVAANYVQSKVDEKLATYGEDFNRTMRAWVENQVQEEKTKTENLEILLNHKIQQGAELQSRVQILDTKANTNNANVDKLRMRLTELRQKISGTSIKTILASALIIKLYY